MARVGPRLRNAPASFQPSFACAAITSENHVGTNGGGIVHQGGVRQRDRRCAVSPERNADSGLIGSGVEYGSDHQAQHYLDHDTVTFTLCQEFCPFSHAPVGSAGCVRPASSTARTISSWSPAAGIFHSDCHRTHV